MFYSSRPSKGFTYFINYLAIKNRGLTTATRNYTYFLNHSQLTGLCGAVQSKGFLISNDQSRLILSRNKGSSKKIKQAKRYGEESSDEEDMEDDDDVDDDSDDEQYLGKGGEVKKIAVKSLRLDTVLKSALMHSRTKIEKIFYENNIRVNGKIVLKKSTQVAVDDELDVIRGYSQDSPNSIVVGRVKILNITADANTEKLRIKILKIKSLTVENYQDNHVWRGPIAEG